MAPTTIFDKLASIGCQFADVKLVSMDIEEALAEAIEVLPYSKDRGRILKVLFSWIDENGSQVILEKLAKVLSKKKADGAEVFYAALLGAFAVNRKMHKWKILRKFQIDGVVAISDNSVDADNNEDWAKEAGFLLSAGGGVPDPKYSLKRSQLAKMHRQYRNRLIYGPQYRADIMTALQLGITSSKDIVKLVGVSREPVSRILAELKDAGVIDELRVGQDLRVSYLDTKNRRQS